MFGFLGKWFINRPNAIGIDFGTNTLRMAQVQFDGSDFHLIAAAMAEVPPNIRMNLPARMDFFTHVVRDLLIQGKFRGRSAVIGLPSAWTTAVHQQVDGDAINKLPLNPPDTLVRHIAAGQIETGDRRQSEVITLSAPRENVNALLKAAARAGLDITAMPPEPAAIVDCFAHVYRRKADADSTTCYLDIGSSGTRMVVARAGSIMLICNIPIGGDELNTAVAAALDVEAEDAALLRRKLQHHQHITREHRITPGIDQTGENVTDPSGNDQSRNACEAAMEKPLQQLVQKLRIAQREHNAAFPRLPIDRILFTGGEARSAFVCRFISNGINLPAQVGDPMVRLSRGGGNYAQRGIDRRVPQPPWSVALGLTMGPADQSETLPVPVDHRVARPHHPKDRPREAA
jgi:Tfp pilus assembly PilM family ATPase